MQSFCKIQKLKATIRAQIGVDLIISNQNTYIRSLNSPSHYIPCPKVYAGIFFDRFYLSKVKRIRQSQCC